MFNSVGTISGCVLHCVGKPLMVVITAQGARRDAHLHWDGYQQPNGQTVNVKRSTPSSPQGHRGGSRSSSASSPDLPTPPLKALLPDTEREEAMYCRC